MENNQTNINAPKIKLDFKDSKYATGRRKTSIAKIWLKKGSGQILVNGKKYDDLIGSRAQVWHKTAFKTSAGRTKSEGGDALTRVNLKKNKHGRIVSVAKAANKDKLLAQLRNEILPIIDSYKNYFKMERPNELARRYNIDFKIDYLKSAQTPSYPSGHSAQAYYIATKLSKLYPSLTKELMTMANMIAQARIDRGVHFLSDIEAGKLLGLKLAKQ